MGQPSYGSGLEAALAVAGGKGKPLVVGPLATNGPRRFSQLRRLVGGIGEGTLIAALKGLASDGIVVRNDFRDISPRVENSLTEFGLELSRALLPLDSWGSTSMRRISALPRRTAQAQGTALAQRGK